MFPILEEVCYLDPSHGCFCLFLLLYFRHFILAKLILVFHACHVYPFFEKANSTSTKISIYFLKTQNLITITLHTMFRKYLQKNRQWLHP